ncbi:plasmid replication protein, CyRepA1 family [Burkholderia pseudomallei]|uniref:plasmid replication protein, CyRepA1 family n=1 Tax=Burkholderia pseudomallei TaxID=28450 RepID=UPI0015C34A50|nr:plasmid replication protein, CyRepA1 family [Burkholderia pseudomallei]
MTKFVNVLENESIDRDADSSEGQYIESAEVLGTLEKFDIRYVRERRLSAAIVKEWIDFNDADIILIKSTKDTGKTRVLGDFVKSLPKHTSVLQIGHRKSLSRSLAKRLNLTTYLDVDGIECRFSLSLDSLIRIDPTKDQPYDVLILDESEQVFQHLFGDTTEAKREQIFSTLQWLIHHAKKIICSDADMTGELTGYLIAKLRSSFKQDRVLALVNEWQVGRTINIYETKYHALAQMVCAVAEGKRVYVPVGEEKFANQLATLLKLVERPDGKAVEVLLLTGPNSEQQEVKDFFVDPNAEALKYHVIVATSTLSTGVSIDVDGFDAVYGLFDGSVYTYQDCDQAISRVRKCKSVNVWIHNGRPPKFPSENELRDRSVTKEQRTRRLFMPDEAAILRPVEQLYLDSETRVRWCQAQWSVGRLKKFVNLKKIDGWNVRLIANDPKQEAAGREMRRIGRDPNGDRRHLSILSAENLTEEEFDELSGMSGLKAAKKNARLKYWIAKTFGASSPSEVTLPQIVQYMDKGARDVVRNLKLMAARGEDARRWDKEERESPNGKAFTNFDHRSFRHEIFNGVREASGIDPARVLENAKRYSELLLELEAARRDHKDGSRPYRRARQNFTAEKKANQIVVDSEQLDRVLEYVEQNLETINTYLETRFNAKHVRENKVKVFNKVMGSFGVAVKREPVMKNGESTSQLVVDYEKVMELAKSEKLRDLVDQGLRC